MVRQPKMIDRFFAEKLGPLKPLEAVKHLRLFVLAPYLIGKAIYQILLKFTI